MVTQTADRVGLRAETIRDMEAHLGMIGWPDHQKDVPLLGIHAPDSEARHQRTY